MATDRTDPLILALDDPRWASLVGETNEATPFHHPAWAQVLAQTYGYSSFAIAVPGDDGCLAAGAPFLEVRSLSRRRRWISLPFTDECPLLASSANSRSRLIGALGLTHERLRAPGLEVRSTVDGFGWRMAADAVTHELDLGAGLDGVRAGFSRSQVTRNIARAQREGVVVRHGIGDRDLDAFYQLHTRTRRRQGVPVQPRRFFELLWSGLVESGLAYVLLADGGGREAIAGALFLRSGATSVYKFGASDVDSWRLRPNHLIFWTAIQHACECGDRRLDFGRTDLGNGGLRAFKSGWGAKERPLIYSTLAPGAAAAGVGRASRALSVAIRKGPEWICRGTGEALYRYAASR